MIELTVSDWAAWAPGRQERAAWQAWAAAPDLPAGEQAPPLAEVPAMQRRRIERLGRMAIQAAYWCQQAEAGGWPLVFVSRHGDVQRSLDLLVQQARGEPLSPTGFGLSVHNAVAAQYSIMRGDRGNYTALAAGHAGVEAALVEASALLADGAPGVLLVAYDAPLPAAYAGFRDEPEAPFAWSWQLRAHGPGVRLGLTWETDGGVAAPPLARLPAALEALRFLLSNEDTRSHRCDGLHWQWRRHG